ncbi:MAG: helix-turn-helix transcriptional regulator, partial [Acaryochloris sp. RU_4_1]|nr:helix-turn-helix transcriptional regulator [Acaryochloris sp. RU_4_1]
MKNPKPSHVTELEELSLRALVNCTDTELYGLQIQKSIEEIFHRNIPMGSLYPVLHRLKKRGFVVSRWETSQMDKRSGARRRYYKI